MKRQHPRLAATCAIILLATSPELLADQPISDDQLKFFETKIRPVLAQQCYGCHSNDGQGVRGGLIADSREGLLSGGESGPAIVPGNLDDSLLWNAINFQDFRMPPKKQLSREVIEDFRQWILMGAPDPRVADITNLPARLSADDIEKGKQFWSFKSPERSSTPRVSDPRWPKTEVDHFVLSELDRQQTLPSADTDAYTFVRRLYFDLIGLPPTSAQVQAFVHAWNDDRDQAIGKEVGRLLDTPQYGERWGRHWLDVVRYAESSGKEVDMAFPHAWRYRDYVIDAFNADKPYDQFILEQIAGDLLPVKTDQEWTRNLIATGFLALGPKTLAEQNPRQFQADVVDEQIDTTTRVILGISVACARCHDHKFDPILQTDYYALAGIFENTQTYFGAIASQRVRRSSDLLVLPAPDLNPFDKAIAPTELAKLKDELQQKREELFEARRAQRMGNNTVKSKNGTTPRPANVGILELQIGQLVNRINGVDDNGQPLSFCMGVQAVDKPRNARVLVRGEINQPAQEVPRGMVSVIGPDEVNIPADSSGRLELAHWLTSRDNPLTARVMVNRIWLHMFGKALVRETDNFGASGPGPTHPQLLDYLAVRFMDSGWSVKSLVREIANSRTYRQSSAYRQDLEEKDPDNLFMARANPRRLDAEAIRDAMLHVAGQLDYNRPRASAIAAIGQTIIGPGGVVITGRENPLIGSPMTKGPPTKLNRLKTFMQGAQRPQSRPTSVTDVASKNRSVYLPISRNSVPRALEVFDFAEPSMIVGERETSNTSQQALYVLNNPMVIELSDAMAQRIARQSPSTAEQIRAAFLIAYGRPATPGEQSASIEFLRNVAGSVKTKKSTVRPGIVPSAIGLSQLCQALMASAEFRFVN